MPGLTKPNSAANTSHRKARFDSVSRMSRRICDRLIAGLTSARFDTAIRLCCPAADRTTAPSMTSAPVSAQGREERKSGGEGRSVAVRVELGGGGIIIKKINQNNKKH